MIDLPSRTPDDRRAQRPAARAPQGARGAARATASGRQAAPQGYAARRSEGAPHSRTAPAQRTNAAPRGSAQGGKSGGHGPKRSRVVDILILAVAIVLIIAIVAPLVENNGGGTLSATAPGSSQGDGTTTPVDGSTLMITEAMSSNKGALCSVDGGYYDWVELYNPTDQPISLQGYGLTDKLDNPNRFVFDKMVLEPKSYLIVYCSDLTGDNVPEGELHAPFKLSSSGDNIYLCDTYGNEMQKVALPAMGSDIAYGLDSATNQWRNYERYTPGYSNDDAGWEAFQKSIRVEDSTLLLNEIMTSNNVTLKDGDGQYNDWVEIVNNGTETVDLSGYGLSDTVSSPKQWSFPEGTKIEPGAMLVVFCSKKNTTDEAGYLHTDFGLNSAEETVVLSDKQGRILDEVEVKGLEADSSYARDGSGSWSVQTKPTPGFANNDDGYNAFQSSRVQANETGIFITEVMLNNVDTLADEFEQYGSWIEITNRSGQAVNLAGYGLTDNTKHLGTWKFPDVTLQAGERTIVFANSQGVSGELSAAQKLNANFSISSSGETLVLTDPDNNVIDICQVSRVPAGMTFARAEGESAFLYMSNPTPGAANSGESYLGMCPMPQTITLGGIYDSAQQVEINVPEGTTVYYTTDCTEPTQQSTQYTGPITVDKNTVIRTKAFRDGYLGSDIDSVTILIGEDHTLPVVSVVADPDDLFSDEKGIYALGTEAKAKYTYPSSEDFPYRDANFNQNWERLGHIELLETDGSVSLDQNFGLRIFGAYSRGHVKKSFACMARGEYGEAYFNYPIFDNLPYEQYKSFVLRSGASEWNMTMIRDVLNSSLAMDHTDVLAQSFRPVVMYLNGQYWGVYFIQEKTNAQFIARHTGADPDKVNLLVGNGNKASYVQQGSNEDYLALLEYVKTHDMSVTENYEYVKTKMDVQNFIDYMLIEMYCGNTDTGNIKFYMSPDTDGKWRWVLYDTDWSFMTRYISLNMVEEYIDPRGHGTGNMFDTTLQVNLLKNSEFRSLFLERAAYICNVMYNPETVVARINELEAMLDPEMERDRTYWNQYSKDDPNAGAISYAGWKKMVGRLREYATGHPEYFKQYIREDLHMTDAEYAQYFGE